MRNIPKSGRLVRSVNISWLESAWRPRISPGTPVPGPARSFPEVFQPKYSRAVRLGPKAGIPMAGPSGGTLPPSRPRIQFPTL